MTINNYSFFTIGFVFAVLGLAQRNLAFGMVGLTFFMLSFAAADDEDDDETE